MNHLEEIEALNNRYFAMRHGKSEANAEGIVVSLPGNGILRCGLVDEGRRQVRESVERALDEKILDENTMIFSSPFRRAVETAELAAKMLGTIPVRYVDALRERSFGDLEGSSHDNYPRVWDLDGRNGHHTTFNIESTFQVQDRMTKQVDYLDHAFSDEKILLVSHGDPLQILQTGFARRPSAHHRQLRHLETAEIREMRLDRKSTRLNSSHRL